MGGWHSKLDQCVLFGGVVVAHVGLIAEVAGFALTFWLDDPIAGEKWLVRGFWIAGLGGAGLYYGIKVDAGGGPKYPGGPPTYEPPPRCWPHALIALGLTPLWAVLSLPLGVMVYGLLLIGGSLYGVVLLIGRVRRA